MSKLTQRWTILLVDDGSTDDSIAAMKKWSYESRISAIELSRNFGKEAAITAGLDSVDCDAVIIMDGDGQHPPELFAQLAARWRNGADIVTATGKPSGCTFGLRALANKAFYALINLGSPARIDEHAGDFRLLDRSAVDAIRALPERTRFMKGLYSWIGFRCESVQFEPGDRRFGSTKFGFLKLIGLSVDGLTTFSNWPLFAIAAIGACISTVSIAYGIFLTFEHALYGNSVSGWSTLAAVLFLSSGLQLLGMGVIGIYLAKVFDEVKQRPLYIIRRRYSTNTGELHRAARSR